jgi:hypothetical protein
VAAHLASSRPPGPTFIGRQLITLSVARRSVVLLEGARMFSLLFVSAVGAVVWMIVRPTPERDAAAAHTWANFHHCAVSNGWQLLEVHSVYERWPPGSKAYVSRYGDAARVVSDSWFWWHHVQPGSVVAVRGLGMGWGSHTGKDGVLYIGSEYDRQSGVQATFGAKELTRAQRHWHRYQPHLGAA